MFGLRLESVACVDAPERFDVPVSPTGPASVLGSDQHATLLVPYAYVTFVDAPFGLIVELRTP